MKLGYRVTLGLFLGLSTMVFAANMNIERGGLGFLYPDMNSFVNPGQFAVAHGMAVEGGYFNDSKSIGPQEGDLSYVYGNGTFGLGVDASRVAPDVTKSAGALDSVTAGLGVALIKEKLTLGGRYSRSISSGNMGIGVAAGTLTLQADRHGPSIGVGYQTTVNSPIKQQSITGGVGYAFRSNNSVEANVYFNDTNNWSDFNLAGFFTTSGRFVYASGGYEYLHLTKQSEVVGRFGVTLGMYVDFSVEAGYVFTSGSPITYGGLLRVAF